MVVNGSGSGRGSGQSAIQVPSARCRIVQHPGAGSQKYSSSLSPSRRARIRCHTWSDRSTSSRFASSMRSQRTQPDPGERPDYRLVTALAVAIPGYSSTSPASS